MIQAVTAGHVSGIISAISNIDIITTMIAEQVTKPSEGRRGIHQNRPVMSAKTRGKGIHYIIYLLQDLFLIFEYQNDFDFYEYVVMKFVYILYICYLPIAKEIAASTIPNIIAVANIALIELTQVKSTKERLHVAIVGVLVS